MRPLRTLLDRRPAWLDLAVVAAFVLWFYAPFLEPGVPPGDFGSDAMVGAVHARVDPSPFAMPAWNPHLMCGRPVVRAPSITTLLALPFAGLETITRLKATVLLYLVLAGWAMVALLRGIGAGGDAALFAGLVYPIGAAPVTRIGVHGHVVVPMLYALIPLFFLALFRAQDGKRKGLVLLALATALCLHRDSQRALLLCVMVGVVLAATSLGKVVFGRSERSIRGFAAAFRDPALLAAAAAIAALVNAFDLVNRYFGDPFAGGWRAGEQESWMARWSSDALYPLVDRSAAMGRALEVLTPLYDESLSGYAGIGVLALVAVGALFPALLGERRPRFWTVAALLPLSLWLSFGPTPVIGRVVARWRFVLGELAIPWAGKAAAVLGLVALLVAGAVATWRNVEAPRHRRALGLAAFAILLALFLCTAPLPLVQQALFFLGDLRNPGWFAVTALPIATVFPAALCVASLHTRWGARRFWAPLFLGMVLVVVLDFLSYRAYLDLYLTPSETIGERIAADPEDFRVLPAERYSNQADLLYLWHGKRLAWDFRSYTAPRRTQELLDTVFNRLHRGPAGREVAVLAGLANVKYLVDNPARGAAPADFPDIRLVERFEELGVYENLAYRPFVQAYVDARVLVGGAGEPGILLAAGLAERGVGLARVEDGAHGFRAPTGIVVVADGESVASGRAPAGAIPLDEARHSVPEAVDFDVPPELRWSRPSNEAIRVETRASRQLFLVVSESFHPWWTVTIDGVPAELFAGQYAFLGAFVPSGDHVVEFRYTRPWTVPFWSFVGLASLLGCIVALFVPRPGGGSGPAPQRAEARSTAA